MNKFVGWIIAVIIIIIVMAFIFVGFGGCQSQRLWISRKKSNMVGLNRVITHTDAGGNVRVWKGRTKCEYEGAWVNFLNPTNRNLRVTLPAYGTIIEEIE